MTADPGVTFTVPSKPLQYARVVPKRPGVDRQGNTLPVRPFVPREQREYAELVGRVAAAAGVGRRRPWYVGVPVALRCAFALPLPKRGGTAGGPKMTRPDLSNYVKLLEDALNGIAWEDDGQIAKIGAAKLWAAGPPFTRVTVYPLAPEPPRREQPTLL